MIFPPPKIAAAADPYAKDEANLQQILAQNLKDGDKEGAETCRKLLREIELRRKLERYAR